jgi:hypothetical protein
LVAEQNRPSEPPPRFSVRGRAAIPTRLVRSTVPVGGGRSVLSFDCMKPLLALFILLVLTGCVIFPHGEWVAPPASGRVLDGDDHQPVARAKVTRLIEAFDRKRVVSTDAHGNFDFKKETHLRWLPFVCYAATPIHYRIEAEGYRPFITNLYGGGSFSHGRQPHELGQILLQKARE